MAKKFRYQHIMSAVEGKLPTAEQLKDAEIAVNVFAGAEKLAVKNSNDEIVTFATEAQVNNAIANAVEGLAVKSAVDEEINAAVAPLQEGIDALEAKKANVEDVPSIEGLAKAEDVTAEIAAAVEPLAVKAEVTEEINAAVAPLQEGMDALEVKKANVEDVPSIEGLAKAEDVTAEIAAAVEPLATKAEVEEAANAAVAKVVAEAPEAFDTLKEVADYIASDQTKAAEIETKLAGYDETIPTLATKAEVEAVDAKVDALDIPSIEGLAVASDVTAEIAAAVAPLALAADVYTKTEADDKFATKEEVALKADSDKVYTQEEVDALLLAKENEIYNLTKIVGDIGGAVTYELPNAAGKSFNTLMNNNGTVKLTEDVTSGRFGPGITAKNAVKLNLNSHDLNITGLTISTAQGAIMARGTQNITIGGKGTIDAGEGICIEGNGADSVINLTGSTSVYRTNRSGGELIYCYAGTINITNGTFRNDGDDKKFVLNCYDANYRNGTAKIVVTGGKFYDFDPGNNAAEGEGTSFLAEGYESVASVVEEDGVEHTVYTVKKSS